MLAAPIYYYFTFLTFSYFAFCNDNNSFPIGMKIVQIFLKYDRAFVSEQTIEEYNKYNIMQLISLGRRNCRYYATS